MKKFPWKILFIFTIIVIAVGLIGLVFKHKVEKSGVTPTTKKIYPDTTEAPVLELAWPGELNPNDATRYTPYGVWEGWFQYENGVAYEPANEMQFYIITNENDFLAVAPGIVTQNEIFEKGVGLVTVRYGEGYAITYMHIFPNSDLEVGDTVETGDVVGKMEKRPHPDFGEETWWEIQLTEKRGDIFTTLPPYEYFSLQSKELLDKIARASKEVIPKDPKTGSYWTITEGCSWIKYTKAPEWWASNRFEFSDQVESEKEWIESLGLGWKVGDEYGRIIGPNDQCK